MPVAVRDVDGEIEVPGDGLGHSRQIRIDVFPGISGGDLDRLHRTLGAERLLQQGPTVAFRLRRAEGQHLLRPFPRRQQIHQRDRRQPSLDPSIPEGVARRLRIRSEHGQQQVTPGSALLPGGGMPLIQTFAVASYRRIPADRHAPPPSGHRSRTDGLRHATP